ncbi:hypothetical protein E2C01_017892 [Portunus trituberculatus]|uniref:Uncharacterized protein n=1 Tax=Portunus trituberculatus TaxID=210409 RepID=A0A5B7DTP1_PORTR|nr:hypothetical protein [Portunus trituberculatus]
MPPDMICTVLGHLSLVSVGVVLLARQQKRVQQSKEDIRRRGEQQEPLEAWEEPGRDRYLRGALRTDAIHATVRGLLRWLLNQASLGRCGDHLLRALHPASTTLSTALCGGGKT